MSKKLAIFLHSHEYDRLYQACSLLLSASSMGWSCHLFLFYGALATFVGEGWDDTDSMPASEAEWSVTLRENFESSNLPSLYDMLERCRGESGGLTVCACTASCKMLDLDMADVRARVDEVVGLPSMMQIAEDATHVLYI